MDMALDELGDSQIIHVVKSSSRGPLRAEVHELILTTAAADGIAVEAVPWAGLKRRIRASFLNANEMEALRADLEQVKRHAGETLVAFGRRFKDAAAHAYLPATRNEDQHRIMIRALCRGLRNPKLVAELVVDQVPLTMEAALANLDALAGRQEFLSRIRVEEPMEISAAVTELPVQETLRALIAARTAPTPPPVASCETTPSGLDHQGIIAAIVQATTASLKPLVQAVTAPRPLPVASTRRGNRRQRGNQAAPRQQDGRPEWDERGLPRCFQCGVYGHFQRGCPQSGNE